MHPEYARFLSLFKTVVRISLDQAKHVPGEHEEEVAGALHVTSEDFFTHLYQPREVVEQLTKKLTTQDLLCLTGPQGSGKTTTVRGLQREVEKQRLGSNLPKSFMIAIDLRIETATTSFDMTNSITIEQSLRARLIREYLTKFFPLPRRGTNPRLKLWAFLLDAEREHLRANPVFFVFGALQDKVTGLLRRFDAQHKTEIPVEEWLERKSNEDDVIKITDEVEGMLDFSHLVHAVYHIEKIAQQVVWLDNADTLSDRQQTDTMIAIRRLFTPVSSLVRMGISIREENVFREYDISDDGAPPLETRVMVEIPRGAGSQAYYPSRDIPLADPLILKQIIHNRLEFTRKAQLEAVTRLNADIKLAEAGESNLDEDILKKRLENLTPVISQEKFGNIQLLASKLVKRLHDEGAILLANNSLRDYMMIVRDCLADLLTADKPGKDNASEALKYEPWYLSTLFFRRIRHAQRRYKMGIYDVLAAADQWFKQGRQGAGCLLSHLILVAAWNQLLGEKGPEHGIAKASRVGDIVSRLEPLGYSRKAIIDNLHSLYFYGNSRQNLLEIRGRTPITSPEGITDDMRIYLTYRGKGLTARIGGSFGYLYDCLRLLEGGSDADDALIEHSVIQSTDEVIDKLLPHLCDIAQMHYITLRELRLKGISLNEYMQKFGIPVVPPYRRSGQPLLQLQMILTRLASYVQRSPHQVEKIGELYTKYTESIQALEHLDPSAPVPDFRGELGVPPRAEKEGA